MKKMIWLVLIPAISIGGLELAKLTVSFLKTSYQERTEKFNQCRENLPVEWQSLLKQITSRENSTIVYEAVWRHAISAMGDQLPPLNFNQRLFIATVYSGWKPRYLPGGNVPFSEVIFDYLEPFAQWTTEEQICSHSQKSLPSKTNKVNISDAKDTEDQEILGPSKPRQARIYTNIGGARAIVTWFATRYPEFPTPRIIRLLISGSEMIDETERIEKIKQKPKTWTY